MQGDVAVVSGLVLVDELDRGFFFVDFAPFDDNRVLIPSTLHILGLLQESGKGVPPRRGVPEGFYFTLVLMIGNAVIRQGGFLCMRSVQAVDQPVCLLARRVAGGIAQVHIVRLSAVREDHLGFVVQRSGDLDG